MGVCIAKERQVVEPKVSKTSSSASSSRVNIFGDITDTIGETPIVRINRLAASIASNVFVKLEYFNPLGSVKDRLALGIIEAAEASGELRPGGTVVEATSGNTGIGLAMVCAQRGYSLVIVMSESFSVERRQLMRALGAKVLVTPVALGGTGMVRKAEELAEKNGWFLARQFECKANAEMHRRTTGPEITNAFKERGLSLDYFVCGYGTGGTWVGVAQHLRQASPKTKVVLSEPDSAPLALSGKAQERLTVLGMYGAPARPHPEWMPHAIQGWAPNFIPYVAQQGIDEKLYSEILPVNGKTAIQTCIDLGRFEGIFCGVSSGAAVAIAMDVARKAPPGSNILTIATDTAERYLSTPLFDSIQADMDEEELRLHNSTPLGRA